MYVVISVLYSSNIYNSVASYVAMVHTSALTITVCISMATYLDAILLNMFVMAVIETNLQFDILREYVLGLTVSNREKHLEDF